MNKLDKAIKEELDKFEEEIAVWSYDELKVEKVYEDLLGFLQESNKRIAKVALEASKLEETGWREMREKYNTDSTMTQESHGYNLAVHDQRKIIKELTDENN